MTITDLTLAAIAAILAAGVWVLHHHLRRIVAAQPPAYQPLGVAWEQWQGDEQTWQAVREALRESATDMERTPS